MAAKNETKDAPKGPAPKAAAPKSPAPKAAAPKTPKVTMNKGVAKDGDTVFVHYTGTFADGQVFDSSEGREPLAFKLGEHRVVPGFENAIRGMKAGEKKRAVLAPMDAYGDHNPMMVQDVPLDAVKAAGITPEKGMVLALSHPSQPGMQLPAKVVDVTEKTVKLDLNHPLAGKELRFDVELVKIE